ncbi:DUF6233 domain-containing protein [Streptomyces filipinensis]|uniref:DUF6233 domain-containing protein n=1 Tax=Streptomyces filipinensis TaxID=66887 RepID=UPI0036E95B30
MNDALSRLELLRFARRVVVQQTAVSLAQLDQRIADEERREAERRQGEERRPADPEWLIQYGLNKTNVDAVHAGDCWAAKKSGRCKPVTRQEAVDALRRRVAPCVHCQPEAKLDQ